MKKIDKTTRLRIRMGATLMALAFSLTAFGYATYSWFTAIRTKNIELMNINVPDSLGYSLKYYTGNSTTGYAGPDLYNNDTNASVSDYSADFLTVPDNYGESPTLLSQPGYRQSFSLEVTSGISNAQNITLTLDDYYSPASETFFDASTNMGISLDEATNIYVSVIDQDTDNNTYVTSQANSFIQASNPGSGNIFQQSSPLEMANSTIGGTNPTKIIFLFTIEFSDAPATYYQYSSESDGIKYYNKSPSGNSNVYQDLIFLISSLSVTN